MVFSRLGVSSVPLGEVDSALEPMGQVSRLAPGGLACATAVFWAVHGLN